VLIPLADAGSCPDFHARQINLFGGTRFGGGTPGFQIQFHRLKQIFPGGGKRAALRRHGQIKATGDKVFAVVLENGMNGFHTQSMCLHSSVLAIAFWLFGRFNFHLAALWAGGNSRENKGSTAASILSIRATPAGLDG
jgi:hypothetical protein